MEIIELDYDQAKRATIDELGNFVLEKLTETMHDTPKESDADTNDMMLREPEEFSFAVKKGKAIMGKIYGRIDSFNSSLRDCKERSAWHWGRDNFDE